MPTQNLNTYYYPKYKSLLNSRQYFDLTLAADERDYDEEVVFSNDIIGVNDGTRLPISLDLNFTGSSPQLTMVFNNFYSGSTLVSKNYYNPNNLDYTFSRFPFMYGWASWQSRWKKIQRKNINWEEMKSYGLNEQYSLSKKKTEYLTKLHERIYNTLEYFNKNLENFGYEANQAIKTNYLNLPLFNLTENNDILVNILAFLAS
jgi:hypothetical protein